MATMYCALCKRPVEARRQIGAGTVVLAFLTAGLSLLAVPFYARRCAICKSTAVTDAIPDAALSAPRSGPPAALPSELEARLRRTEDELDAVNRALDHARTERDFYRQLLGDRPIPDADAAGRD